MSQSDGVTENMKNTASKKSTINKYSLHIPEKLKLPIAWTLFFALIGIIQQSLVAKHIIFLQFFTNGYLGWFYLLGNIALIYHESGIQEIMTELFKIWYYFFFTGGLISVIRGILYTLTES